MRVQRDARPASPRLVARLHLLLRDLQTALERAILDAARTKQTGVSMLTLLQFGKQVRPAVRTRRRPRTSSPPDSPSRCVVPLCRHPKRACQKP